jgi:WhiB family redox-sensing transcriptional regulator
MTGYPAKFDTPNLPNAACTTSDPELFYADDCINPDKVLIEKAREICITCPERIKCLNWAMVKENYGMWGGLTANERKDFKRGRFHKLKHVAKIGLIDLTKRE